MEESRKKEIEEFAREIARLWKEYDGIIIIHDGKIILVK